MLSSLTALLAPDLVMDATRRLLPPSPAIFLTMSCTAGFMALLLTARNAWMLRERTRRQERDLTALRARERRLRLTMQDSEDGLVHLEPLRDTAGAIVDFAVTDANLRAAMLFRRTLADIDGLRTSMLASLAPDTALFRALVQTLESGQAHRTEVRAHPRHVATSWLAVRAVPVDQGLAITLTDIRERKREAARLRRASFTDELTGLLNRRAFLTMAEEQLQAARKAGHDAVLFYLDCDAFKQINDTYGHATGDRALREIARALRGAVRESDLVARMGGDEFTMLAVDAIGDCADTIRARVFERIDALNALILLPTPVGVSVGHVYAPATGTISLEDLLETADRDLLQRKQAHRAARTAADTIMPSTNSPRARRSAKRAVESTRLTGAVTAA